MLWFVQEATNKRRPCDYVVSSPFSSGERQYEQVHIIPIISMQLIDILECNLRLWSVLGTHGIMWCIQDAAVRTASNYALMNRIKTCFLEVAEVWSWQSRRLTFSSLC